MKFYLLILILSANLCLTNPVEAQETHAPSQKFPTTQSLQLIISTDKSFYKMFQPIHLKLILRNISKKEIILFQPDSIHQINSEWTLQCKIRKPNGQEVRIEPEITYSNMPIAKRKNFVSILPGEEIAFSVDINDRLNQNQPLSPWVAIIDSWSHMADKLKSSDFYARKIKGVVGDYLIISGSKNELAVKDLLKDVFNNVGTYVFECEYTNNIVSYLEAKENGYMTSVEVPGCWKGTLRSFSSIEISK
ncbi:MAG: hypothetical protein WC561_03480 [Candidatus Omnitrophota bacterium]